MGQKHTLFFAAEKGRTDDLKWVLHVKKVSPNLRDHETQEVALHLAASKGHVECVKLLLNAGANVDARNSYGLTPLHLAVCDGKVGCVQALIEGGADVNATSRFGCTPLHQAAYFNRLKCCQALLHAGAWVDVVESWGRTPLFLAIEKSNIDIVTLLLKHKASVHIRESIKGHTSLILASSLGNTACMRCLLDYNADPNCQDIFGHTPLHYVVKETTNENTEKCIRQLAAYGAVCLRDNNDKSPVDILLDKNRVSDAETLIKLTCKPRSLRSICWVKVRQNLQRQKILDLHELKVPKCIINFIEDDVAFLKTD